MMRTFTCFGEYRVGADGMPELKEDVFNISWVSDEIKSLKDIEVTVVDADGNESAWETLPAGTHIKPVRTDMSTYVDARLDDGRLVRFRYSKEEYPYEIGGENVDDLFEGLQYAG